MELKNRNGNERSKNKTELLLGRNSSLMKYVKSVLQAKRVYGGKDL